MTSMPQVAPDVPLSMTLTNLRTSAAIVFGLLFASFATAQTRPTTPASPYGGTTVEEIVARVNDQIITRSDYDRAMQEMDAEARKNGASMQEISAGHRDLLRTLIDQQLWLSKGKELGLTGETELVNKLNDIRKQFNLDTIEDLEKEAKEQGVSFEDFKAHIRNQIITQQVMREEVGHKIQFTPGEAERYFEAHKQEYARQESIHLGEILVAVAGTSTADSVPGGAAQPQDGDAKLAAAKAKADDIESRLHAGGDFGQMARSFSDGPTASEGGDLGQFQRGSLAKVLEDKTFVLKSGEFTEPIRTKQGWVILKVIDHVPGGIPAYKDVQSQVEDNFYMSRMEPAIRDYLTKMREESYIDIKPGYSDTGASPRQTKPVYSAYVPPSPKKKKKAERTRYRETTHTFRQKTKTPPAEISAEQPPASQTKKGNKKKNGEVQAVNLATGKPAKKEKIRYGKAPTNSLPEAASTKVEDAGALPQPVSVADEPANPLEAPLPSGKTRFSARARAVKEAKASKQKGKQSDKLTPEAPDSAEVADRQTQNAPLGLSGDTATKKKSVRTTDTKTRMSEKKKDKGQEQQGDQPLAPAPAPSPTQPAAPAPATQNPPQK